MKRTDLLSYTRSPNFSNRLGLPPGTPISLVPLGQGEYNQNFFFVHPLTGQKLVLRVNTGSQMHLENQIEYEFSALQELKTSGRTPCPLFCDGASSELGQGVLVMEWLPGRPLNYRKDMRCGRAWGWMWRLTTSCARCCRWHSEILTSRRRIARKTWRWQGGLRLLPLPASHIPAPDSRA